MTSKQERYDELAAKDLEDLTDKESREQTQLYYELHTEVWNDLAGSGTLTPRQQFGVDTSKYE